MRIKSACAGSTRVAQRPAGLLRTSFFYRLMVLSVFLNLVSYHSLVMIQILSQGIFMGIQYKRKQSNKFTQKCVTNVIMKCQLETFV